VHGVRAAPPGFILVLLRIECVGTRYANRRFALF